MVSLTTARPCGWNVAPVTPSGRRGARTGPAIGRVRPPAPFRGLPAPASSAGVVPLRPALSSTALPQRRGNPLAPLPRRQVKKVGEPCTLYCKGRILGYKRRAAPALRAWGGVASGAAAWLGLRGRAA